MFFWRQAHINGVEPLELRGLMLAFAEMSVSIIRTHRLWASSSGSVGRSQTVCSKVEKCTLPLASSRKAMFTDTPVSVISCTRSRSLLRTLWTKAANSSLVSFASSVKILEGLRFTSAFLALSSAANACKLLVRLETL
eukprot:Skav205315  [mRNA]  locus=scaffold3444:171719:174431:- [translate_table: standard]